MDTPMERPAVRTRSFVAIDFQTANDAPASICAVGITSVDPDGGMLSERVLVKPPVETGPFNPLNSAVHGIHAADVSDAPALPEVLQRIIEIADGNDIVVYDAVTKSAMIDHAYFLAGVILPDMDPVCVLELSKDTVQVRSRRLASIARALSLAEFEDGDAAAQSLAVAAIYNKLSVPVGDEVQTPEAKSLSSERDAMDHEAELFPPSVSQSVQIPSPPDAQDVRDQLKGEREEAVETPQESNQPDLTDEYICFSGGLKHLPRWAAEAVVRKIGGRVQSQPTPETTIFVEGYHHTTTKATIMVKMLNESNRANIKTMQEIDFFSMVGFSPSKEDGWSWYWRNYSTEAMKSKTAEDSNRPVASPANIPNQSSRSDLTNLIADRLDALKMRLEAVSDDQGELETVGSSQQVTPRQVEKPVLAPEDFSRWVRELEQQQQSDETGALDENGPRLPVPGFDLPPSLPQATSNGPSASGFAGQHPILGLRHGTSSVSRPYGHQYWQQRPRVPTNAGAYGFSRPHTSSIVIWSTLWLLPIILFIVTAVVSAADIEWLTTAAVMIGMLATCGVFIAYLVKVILWSVGKSVDRSYRRT